jgi:sugar-specific transcriptional regulator TrmB
MKLPPAFCSLLLLQSAILVSCSSPTHNVDEDLKKEPTPNGRKELGESASRLIDEAQNITSDQKARLYQLQARIRNELDVAQGESLKVRSLIVKNLISPDYQERKNRELKRRLRELEGQRLTILLNAVDDANRILGNTNQKNDRILRQMLEAHQTRF